MRIEPVEDIARPAPATDADYNASPEGKARRKRYRHENSKWQTDAAYLSRRIVGIDGEGVTRPDGSHDYIMLAITDQPSLRNPDDAPLTTAQIFRYLFSRLQPDDLNVIYGGSYDFNMFLKGIPRESLLALYKGGFLFKGIRVGDYQVRWTRGKKFSITRGNRTVTIYDTVSFFQQPFVGALDAVLKEYEGRDFLVAQKAARGTFDVGNADEISAYNNLEVELLARLIGILREHLNSASLRPSQWYGPGAIASALLRREGIHDAMADSPPAVADATRHAYAGGRFEMFKYGDSFAPVWEYDINSCYPAAIQGLPNLAQGDWVRSSGDVGDEPFALYHVTYKAKDGDPVHPGVFHYRMKNGAICYPPNVTTWVWSPEMAAARRYVEKYGGTLTVTEVWAFKRHPGGGRPFEFVGSLYAKRQNAKAIGDGVQIAYKLALNSLYGKLAQQVGWVKASGGKPAKLPPYHQLEWAGYVTSYCRGMILDAITIDRDAVIAVETDALFTTRPLPLPLNDGLGAWKETRFENMTYVQSGHYYADEYDKHGVLQKVVKCRGVDRGSIDREMVRAALHESRTPTLRAPLTRFIGAGAALVRGMDKWCRWLTEDKTLSLFPTGKRVHVRCPACQGDKLGDVWHSTVVPFAGGVSHPFPVAWVNPDPNMTELEELRALEYEYED